MTMRSSFIFWGMPALVLSGKGALLWKSSRNMGVFRSRGRKNQSGPFLATFIRKSVLQTISSLHFFWHDRLRAWFFVFGVWFVVFVWLFVVFSCSLPGNFDLIFILILLLTDNVTHSTGNAGKKKLLGEQHPYANTLKETDELESTACVEASWTLQSLGSLNLWKHRVQ